MTNNKVNRNYWFVLAVATAGALVSQVVDIVMDHGEWRYLIPNVVVSAMCLNFYVRYRRAVKNGNIYGDVRLFGFRRQSKDMKYV